MIQRVLIRKTTYSALVGLAKKYAPRITCGLLIGKRIGDVVHVDEIYPLPTFTGPKIHFKPSWSAYRSALNDIHEEKKTKVGEFHTHPDGTEELNLNDKRILRSLGSGLWIIATPSTVVPWHFCVQRYKEHFPTESFSQVSMELV